jgi:nucleotide-binding universal stress UspA family protein
MLIAVDLTDSDAEAFVRKAATWGQKMADTLDLVFVDEAADQNPWIPDGQLRSMMSTHYDAWHEQMRTKLGALLELVPEAVRGEQHVIRGLAAPVLLETLAGYDGLIVGNRASSGLARLAHGVVAERVTRQSEKPVLVLPRD